MELLLVRHALPQRDDRPAAGNDPELADVGHAQAKLLADYLAAERIDALYTSPLRRARQSAQPLAERLQLPLTEVPGIAEWDDGTAGYVPVEEMKASADPRWTALVNGETAGGEPIEACAQRVVGALDGIARAHRSQTVVAVCHGMVINLYLADVLGLGPASAFFYPEYTSIHRVLVSPAGQRSLHTVNETAHLRGTGLLIELHRR